MEEINERFSAALDHFTTLDDIAASEKVVPVITDGGVSFSDMVTSDLGSDACEIAVSALLKLLDSKVNLVTMSRSGLVRAIMSRQDLKSRPELLRLAKKVVEAGIPLAFQKDIFKQLLTSPTTELYDLVNHAIEETLPPHYEFDTQRHGYASIEFKALPRPFPPANGGYSFHTWLRIQKASNDMHITLFGAFDSSQKSFTMAYIEKGSNCLILQSSLKASMRFKFHFQTDSWYSIAIVHKRPRNTSSAKATLFVNGEMVEALRIPYPSPSATTSTVQAFLGSLRQFAPSGNSSVAYSLGHTILVGQIITPELVSLYHKLGPDYVGTYQDYLSSYLTYEASSQLKFSENPTASTTETNVRNSEHMPLNSIILSLSAALNIPALLSSATNLVLDCETRATLKQISEKGKSEIVLNCAIPDLTAALRSPGSFGTLEGGVNSVRPTSFASNVYKLGGTGSLLYLVENASTPEQFIISVEICLKTIGKSYINSEDFERSHGYEMLARLIKEKPHEYITKELLCVIMKFVGLDQEFLANPLAYRYLVADFDLWSVASQDVQRTHLNQFLIFGNSKVNGVFNNNRLSRVGVVKKILTVLRRSIDDATLPYYMTALKGLLVKNFSTDNIRSISSFVIFMLHKKGHKRKCSIKVSGPEGQGLAKPTSKQNVGLAVLTIIDEILCDPNITTKPFLDKFAFTITNRWSLLLLSIAQTRMLALRILARLLVTQGKSYVSKFAGKNDGFTICEALLQNSTEDVWPYLFAVLFGQDLSEMSLCGRNPTLGDLQTGSLEVVVPEVFAVIIALLRCRVKDTMALDETITSPFTTQPNGDSSFARAHQRRTSLDNVMGDAVVQPLRDRRALVAAQDSIEGVFSFLSTAHAKSRTFRELCRGSSFLADLNRILFLVACPRHSVPDLSLSRITSPAASIHSTHQEENTQRTDIERVKDMEGKARRRAPSLRRSGSSFILLGMGRYEHCDVPIEHGNCETPNEQPHEVMKSLLDKATKFVSAIIIDGVLGATDMVLPNHAALNEGSTVDHRRFWSLLQTDVVSTLVATLNQDRSDLTTIRPFTNLSKYISSLYTSIEDGLFIQGEIALFALVGQILEYLLKPEVRELKAVKICDNSVISLQQTFRKLTLLRLSDTTRRSTNFRMAVTDRIEVMDNILYHQQILLGSDADSSFVRLLMNQLYRLTTKDCPLETRHLAIDVLRCLTLLQSSLSLKLLSDAKDSKVRAAAPGWEDILASDSETFLTWLEDNRENLDNFFLSDLGQYWVGYANMQNKATSDRANEFKRRRRDQMKSSTNKIQRRSETITKYETTSSSWYDNVVRVESTKNIKINQDMVDNVNFIASRWASIRAELTRPLAIFDTHRERCWRLDQTECAARQRMKLRPDPSERTIIKVKGGAHGTPPNEPRSSKSAQPQELDYEVVSSADISKLSLEGEEDEDKNRKVLRSLELGDEVREVYNISRIAGLNAIEGLLILGQHKLYMIDNYFNRSDNEICNITDPTVQSQRDPILQVLAGQEAPYAQKMGLESGKLSHECRSFAYDAVTSASKRQFLFRDVAVEMFFRDGRSYLITALNSERDTIHRKIVERSTLGDSLAELSRKDTVNTLGSFGSKLLSVFSNTPAMQAASRWERREISNFEYLMTINSLAGRSYNDLTQYPVMPWVLADYTSDSLDLYKPASFRDLSKNMGSQTSERKRDFQDRYASFASAGIEEIKPFHFGTHYSSAMIVCSYLIRLVPFVDSYLLLQGGHFDHPDRLFYSIEKAWLSASKDNMTDVREITPEWYYLPEFLKNSNGFDFGTTQGSKHKIGDVVLPPWACGSPEIFIEKHREALESEYVSQRLHLWIDLVFGYKQLGQPAIEATNVYHALSYHGAIDLDTVKDPVERLATIGIIHNFGQTPRQVFQKPHSQRGPKTKIDLFDSYLAPIEMLPTRMEFKGSLHDIVVREVITGISYARVPLAFRTGYYVEWLTTDNSIRIKNPEGELVGHFPSLHAEPITHCQTVGTSLILASDDTTISVSKIAVLKNRDFCLQNQTYLRGHLGKITALEVSDAFSVIVSGDETGVVLVFDLNRQEYVRTLMKGSSSVTALAVCKTTGRVVVCYARRICLFSINGVTLASVALHEDDGDVVSCRVHSNDTIFTGHARGLAIVWKVVLRPLQEHHWTLMPIKKLQQASDTSEVTCIKATSTRLYVGTSGGHIYTWIKH